MSIYIKKKFINIFIKINKYMLEICLYTYFVLLQRILLRNNTTKLFFKNVHII